MLHELLCADDFVPISGTMEGLRNKFRMWNEAFGSKVWSSDHQLGKPNW